jgi:hypothetical protein
VGGGISCHKYGIDVSSFRGVVLWRGGIRVSSMVFEFEGAIIYSKNRGNPETFT